MVPVPQLLLGGTPVLLLLLTPVLLGSGALAVLELLGNRTTVAPVLSKGVGPLGPEEVNTCPEGTRHLPASSQNPP
jgi:hypothetical protein